MKRNTARRLLASLPAGLTCLEVAARLGWDYQTARRAILAAGYRAADARKFSQRAIRKLTPEDLDPRLSPSQIARKTGVTKQRVSRLAKQLGVKLKDTRGRTARAKIKARGRPKNSS